MVEETDHLQKLRKADAAMTPKPWVWKRSLALGAVARELTDYRGRVRATVYKNGTWWTWDELGTGGENLVCEGRYAIQDAMDQAMAAIVRQGWVSWKVEYQKAKV